MELGTLALSPERELSLYGFDGLERIRLRSMEACDWQEESVRLMVINAAVQPDKSREECDVAAFDATVLHAVCDVQQHNLRAGSIVMSHRWFAALLATSRFLQPTPQDEAFETSVWGYWQGTIPVYVSPACPRNALYVVARPDYAGVALLFSEDQLEVLSGKVYPEDGAEPVVWFAAADQRKEHVLSNYIERDGAETRITSLAGVRGMKDICRGWLTIRSIGTAVANDYSLARVLRK